MMSLKSALSNADRRLQDASFSTTFLLALASVIAIGIPDYLFGVDISLFILYIVPVGIGTWYAGKHSGVFLAILSSTPLMMEQVNAHYFVNRQGLFFWNLFMHVCTLLVIVYLLDMLVVHLRNEAALARVDAVTGVFNRLGFFERLEFSVNLMARQQIGFGLVYIDLDDFKKINDKYGHDEGDRVLRLTASLLGKSVRHSDVAARLGGDEFALLLHGVDRHQAVILIEKLRVALHRAFQMERVAVTCSIGCVTFRSFIPDPHSAIKAADLLMYEVKRHGKNNVLVEEYEAMSAHSATKPQ